MDRAAATAARRMRCVLHCLSAAQRPIAMAFGIPYTSIKSPVESGVPLSRSLLRAPKSGSSPLASMTHRQCYGRCTARRTSKRRRPAARSNGRCCALRPLGRRSSCRIILDSSTASWAKKKKEHRRREQEDGTGGDGEHRHRICADVDFGTVAQLVRIAFRRPRPHRDRRRQNHRHQHRPVGRQRGGHRACVPQLAPAPAPVRHHARCRGGGDSAHHLHRAGAVPLQCALAEARRRPAAVLDRNQATGRRRGGWRGQGRGRRQSVGGGEDRRHRRHRHEPRQRARHCRRGGGCPARSAHLARSSRASSSRFRSWLLARP